VEETEIFKICLEYWNALASELYRDSPCAVSAPLFVNKQVTLELPPRRLLYIPVLSKVRQVMISRMAKPEEVLVVENDQGEVVREFMKDTDSINLYKNMRETLGTYCSLPLREPCPVQFYGMSLLVNEKREKEPVCVIFRDWVVM